MSLIYTDEVSIVLGGHAPWQGGEKWGWGGAAGGGGGGRGDYEAGAAVSGSEAEEGAASLGGWGGVEAESVRDIGGHGDDRKEEEEGRGGGEEGEFWKGRQLQEEDQYCSVSSPCSRS